MNDTNEQNLITEIIAGTPNGENPSDVVFMCMVAALAEICYNEKIQGPITSGLFYEKLQKFATIGCPLTQFTKTAEYTVPMIKVRERYAGIATSPELQAEFTDKIMTLIREGKVSSVETAVENKIWQDLAPSSEPVFVRTSDVIVEGDASLVIGEAGVLLVEPPNPYDLLQGHGGQVERAGVKIERGVASDKPARIQGIVRKSDKEE